MHRVLERFDVDLRLGPTGHSKETKIIVGGVDVTGACRGVRVLADVNEITTLELDMVPKQVIEARIEQAAIVPLLALDEKDVELRARLGIVTEVLRHVIERTEVEPWEIGEDADSSEGLNARAMIARNHVAATLRREVLEPLRGLLAKGETDDVREEVETGTQDG